MAGSTHRGRRGFTLVEPLVGIFILALTGAMFYALMPTATKTGKMVGNSSQAASLVQHKIDQLRGVGYGRLTYKELSNAGIVDTSPNTSPFSFKVVDNLNSLYTNPVATVTVSDFTTDIRQVTVTLTWSGNGNKPSSGTITASALIAKG